MDWTTMYGQEGRHFLIVDEPDPLAAPAGSCHELVLRIPTFPPHSIEEIQGEETVQQGDVIYEGADEVDVMEKYQPIGDEIPIDTPIATDTNVATTRAVKQAFHVAKKKVSPATVASPAVVLPGFKVKVDAKKQNPRILAFVPHFPPQDKPSDSPSDIPRNGIGLPWRPSEVDDLYSTKKEHVSLSEYEDSLYKDGPSKDSRSNRSSKRSELKSAKSRKVDDLTIRNEGYTDTMLSSPIRERVKLKLEKAKPGTYGFDPFEMDPFAASDDIHTSTLENENTPSNYYPSLQSVPISDEFIENLDTTHSDVQPKYETSLPVQLPIERPEIEHPEIERPEIERPEIERPEIEHRKIERRQIERPKTPLIRAPIDVNAPLFRKAPAKKVPFLIPTYGGRGPFPPRSPTPPGTPKARPVIRPLLTPRAIPRPNQIQNPYPYARPAQRPYERPVEQRPAYQVLQRGAAGQGYPSPYEFGQRMGNPGQVYAPSPYGGGAQGYAQPQRMIRQTNQGQANPQQAGRGFVQRPRPSAQQMLGIRPRLARW